ncbi:MAG: hypothetical protein GF315_09940 [candidate division Zixibacteria bacterium]|nr:hypothetical protein [candidate division Zixibacteria bacterium]
MLRSRGFILAVGLVLLFSSTANGQLTGFLDTAENLVNEQSQYGAYIGFFEGGAYSFIGQYRRGVSNWVDFGVKGGLVSVDAGEENQLGGALAGDGKYRILNAAAGDQFDLSIGSGIQAFFTSDYNVFSLSGNFIGSFRLVSGSGRLIIPYACLSPVIEFHNWSNSGKFGDESHSDTEFDLRLNLGSEFKIKNRLSIHAELQLEDDYFGFLGGVNFGQ